MRYVKVNTELLRETIEKSGLTHMQFNESIGLKRCKKMVQNCFQRGVLRKDQAYAIIEKYKLSEDTFIIENHKNNEGVPCSFKWLFSLDNKTLNSMFGVESIEELLESDVTMAHIAKAYEWYIEQKAFEKKHDDFQKRLCELMDEFKMDANDVRASVAGIEYKHKKGVEI